MFKFRDKLTLEETSYKIALHRIREAEQTGALELDLSTLELNRLPRELASLTSLKSLNLRDCSQLSDLSPLTGLTSLQTLNLSLCEQLSDFAPLAGLTSLQSLNLSGCSELSGDLNPLVGLTSLQSLDLSQCSELSGDLNPLASLTSLQSLNLSECRKLSGDMSPLVGLTSLQTLNLDHCLGVRRFAPLVLLPRLEVLSLFGCKMDDDMPPWICGERYGQNVLHEVRTHCELRAKYGPRRDASPKSTKAWPLQPLATPPNVFVSYAWGDTSPIASEEDRQRQEVVERLCRTLEKEHWQVVRDKTTLKYGDPISTFMKTLGLANLVIVVLSAKYLHSPYCVTELYDIYRRSLGEKEDFLRRIIPLVLKDAQIGTWRDRVAYAEYWETEFKAMEQHFTHLGEEDLRLYKAMKRWHNEVGDMLAYVSDVLVPHGFDDIVKDDFAGLRQMLSGR